VVRDAGWHDTASQPTPARPPLQPLAEDELLLDFAHTREDDLFLEDDLILDDDDIDLADDLVLEQPVTPGLAGVIAGATPPTDDDDAARD
jgi:hypothetical protein